MGVVARVPVILVSGEVVAFRTTRGLTRRYYRFIERSRARKPHCLQPEKNSLQVVVTSACVMLEATTLRRSR